MVTKYSRKQAFKLFKCEHLDIVISKTTFDKLKPANIKLIKHSKWLQLVC